MSSKVEVYVFFPQFCFLFKSNFLLKFLLFYFAAAVVKWCFEDKCKFRCDRQEKRRGQTFKGQIQSKFTL